MIDSEVKGPITVHVDARARGAAATVWPVRPDPAADDAVVGRGTELNELLGLLDPTGPGPGGAVVVASVGGAPGVGKTALALAAARAALARGWFDARVLAVELHGYRPDEAEQVWPEQLYPGLLRALGHERIEPDASAQAADYHALLGKLDDDARPVLLVLDDVAAAAQIEPVLPRGSQGHRVLVTSRDTLGDLPGVRTLDLGVLEPAAAVRMVATALARRVPGDERVARDPEAAARLVELCGGLPLAVQIATAMLADEPEGPIGVLVDELVDETTRLAALSYSDRWAVRAAFDLSLRRVGSEDAELFRRLAAVPGPDLGVEAAAAASDQPVARVRGGLRRLTRAHLLERRPDHRRWRLHDLIRLYAVELLSGDERRVAAERVLGWYQRTVDLALQRVFAFPDDQGSGRFAGAAEALGWMQVEQAGMVAAVVAAVRPDDAIGLALKLAPLFGRTRALQDWLATATVARDAAAHASTPALAGHAWDNVGTALRESRRADEAVAAYEHALAIYQELGDRYAEAATSNNLGVALRQARRVEDAISAHERARDVFRKLGDRHGEGFAWDNLGAALTEARRFEDAVTALTHHLTISHTLGDRHGEATAWNNLGVAFRQVGRVEDAVSAHQHARDVFRELGDRHGEAVAWNNLGLLERWFVRRIREAVSAFQHARDIFGELGDRHAEADAALSLAAALGEAHRPEEAITALRRARTIFQALGDRDNEGFSWESLGNALTQAGRLDEAVAAYRHARSTFRTLGARLREAEVEVSLANVHHDLGRAEEAAAGLRAAARLFDAGGDGDRAGRVRELLASLGTS